MSRVLTIEVTKLMMFDQPPNPTLLDDVTTKTRSISLALQSDLALWQIYIININAQLIMPLSKSS